VKSHAEQLAKLCGDISVLVNIGIAIQKYAEITMHRTKILPVVCVGVQIGMSH